MSSVRRSGRRHVGELAHGLGDPAPCSLTVVIVVRRQVGGARGAFLEGFPPYRLSMRVAARQMSISGITFTTLQDLESR
jgi:hypothetical protein